MDEKHIGIIKSYNGNFGFLKSEIGDIFFHKSVVINNTVVDKGDEVEFKVRLSAKKEGSYEAYDLTLIKKYEKPLDQPDNIIGIIDWFNEERGFGVIKSFDRIEYFLHKSNFINKKLRLLEGNAVVFKEVIEKNRKTAIKCRLANNYEDYKLTLNYFLNSNENVDTISSKSSNFESIKEVIIQITRNKSLNEVLKYASYYFNDNIIENNPEKIIFYFIIIKDVFKDLSLEDKILVFNSFFLQYYPYFKNNNEFKFDLWLDGYTQEKDLNYVAQKIINELEKYSFDDFVETILSKLTDSFERETLITIFLDLVGIIDFEIKLKKIINFIHQCQFNDNVKERFLLSVYNLWNDENKFQMWLDGHTQEKNLNHIAKKIINEIEKYSFYDFVKKILSKLTDSLERETVLTLYLDMIGKIDSENKFIKTISFIEQCRIEDKVIERFLISVYNLCNDKNKFRMWLDGYTQEKDLNYIAKTIVSIDKYDCINFIKNLVTKITDTAEQETLINKLFERVGIIDDDDKYYNITNLIIEFNFDNELKDKLLLFVYNLSDDERKFEMWFDGYTQEKDLNFIAKRIVNINTFDYFYFIKNLVTKITDSSEKETLVNKVFEIVGIIDNDDNYYNIKDFILESNFDKEVEDKLLLSVYNNSDDERKFLMWLDGYTQEKDLNYVAQKIINKVGNYSFDDFIERILSKLTDLFEREIVLTIYLDMIGEIDNENKYTKTISFIEQCQIEDKVLQRFLISVYNLCNDENKFQMWLDGYTQEKDLNYIAQKIMNEFEKRYFYNFIKRIIIRLADSSEKENVINKYLNMIAKVDDEKKYTKNLKIVELFKFEEIIKEKILFSVFNICDDERKFKMWLDGYTQEKDLNYIAQKIIDQSENYSFDDFVEIILSKLTDLFEREIVLTLYLNMIGEIDNKNKYIETISFIDQCQFEDKVLQRFLISVYNLCNDENKFQMWLDGYTQEKDLNYVAQKIIDQSENYSFDDFVEIILSKLTDSFEREIVLTIYLDMIGEIDNKNKYIETISFIDQCQFEDKVLQRFLISVYNLCNDERKFQLWFDGYTQEKDLNYITKRIVDTYRYDYIALIRNLVTKITDSAEKETLVNKLCELFGIIDNDDKYYRIKNLIIESNFDKEVKDKLLLFVYNLSDDERKFQLWFDGYTQEKDLSFIRRKISQLKNDIQIIVKILQKLDVTELKIIFDNHDLIPFYDFCFEILELLSKINESKEYNGYSCLKIYLEDANYIELTNSIHKKKSLFYHKGIFLKAADFESRIKFFQIIKSYIENKKEELELISKRIIDTKDLELIINRLKNFQSLKSCIKQICKDLQIEELEFPHIENYLLNQFDTPELIRLWLNNVIEYFDYFTYAHYYFILSREERIVFNQKMKLLMQEEIKSSMLKTRIPWLFIKKEIFNDQELNLYTATWKSIWFENGFIRICMDKEPSFTKPYHWNFSESSINFLYDYLSRKRIGDLNILAKDDFIIKVDGLEELEETIWKIRMEKEVKDNFGFTVKKDGIIKIPPNILIRNESIQFLNKLQLKELKPALVLEKIKYSENITFDYSLLFSILINYNEVAIVWESLELDVAKATHIFKCSKAEYYDVFDKIIEFISNNIKVRSTLNSNAQDDIKIQKELKYLDRVDHDNFDFNNWKRSLFEKLPELESLLSSVE